MRLSLLCLALVVGAVGAQEAHVTLWDSFPIQRIKSVCAAAEQNADAIHFLETISKIPSLQQMSSVVATFSPSFQNFVSLHAIDKSFDAWCIASVSMVAVWFGLLIGAFVLVHKVDVFVNSFCAPCLETNDPEAPLHFFVAGRIAPRDIPFKRVHDRDLGYLDIKLPRNAEPGSLLLTTHSVFPRTCQKCLNDKNIWRKFKQFLIADVVITISRKISAILCDSRMNK